MSAYPEWGSYSWPAAANEILGWTEEFLLNDGGFGLDEVHPIGDVFCISGQDLPDGISGRLESSLVAAGIPFDHFTGSEDAGTARTEIHRPFPPDHPEYPGKIISRGWFDTQEDMLPLKQAREIVRSVLESGVSGVICAERICSRLEEAAAPRRDPAPLRMIVEDLERWLPRSDSLDQVRRLRVEAVRASADLEYGKIVSLLRDFCERGLDPDLLCDRAPLFLSGGVLDPVRAMSAGVLAEICRYLPDGSLERAAGLLEDPDHRDVKELLNRCLIRNRLQREDVGFSP